MWSGVRRADIGEKEKAEKSVSTSSSVVTSPLKWPACSLAIDTGITARLTMSPHQPNPSGPLTLSVERNTEASHVPVCSTAVPRSVCLRPRRGCSSPGIVRRCPAMRERSAGQFGSSGRPAPIVKDVCALGRGQGVRVYPTEVSPIGDREAR